MENYVIEKSDYTRIKKLRTLHNYDTLYDDARRLLKNVKSDHSIKRYQILIEARAGELLQARQAFLYD